LGSDLAAATKEEASRHDALTVPQRPRGWDRVHVKTRIQCPCGETIVGQDEDQLVELTNAHLQEQHDGRTYDRDMILMMAT
jgi:hypothetical protein